MFRDIYKTGTTGSIPELEVLVFDLELRLLGDHVNYSDFYKSEWFTQSQNGSKDVVIGHIIDYQTPLKTR